MRSIRNFYWSVAPKREQHIWPERFDEDVLFFTGCSWTGGHKPWYTKPPKEELHYRWPELSDVGLKTWNDAFPGRPNRQIMLRAQEAIMRGVKNLFIWWSTYERDQYWELAARASGLNAHPELEPILNSRGEMLVDAWEGFSKHEQEEQAAIWVQESLQYIYIIQELAAKHDVNYKCAISFPSSEAEYYSRWFNVDIVKRLNQDIIMNWPDDFEPQFHYPVWKWWASQLSVRYGVDRGVLEDDLQHLTVAGHKAFAKDFEDFWLIDKKLKNLAKEKDILNWLDKYTIKTDEEVHHSVYNAIDAAKRASSTGLKFIYET